MDCNFLPFSFLVIKRLSGVLWRGMDFFLLFYSNTDEEPFNLVTMKGGFLHLVVHSGLNLVFPCFLPCDIFLSRVAFILIFLWNTYHRCGFGVLWFSCSLEGV